MKIQKKPKPQKGTLVWVGVSCRRRAAMEEVQVLATVPIQEAKQPAGPASQAGIREGGKARQKTP